MHVVFVYGRDTTLRPEAGAERSGGGIVTALLSLVRCLADRGHEVDVFGRCKPAASIGGVRFRDRRTLAGFAASAEPDALVVVPDGLPLLLPIRARARVVWTGNAFYEGDVALTAPWPWAPELGRRGKRARLYPLSLFGSCIDRLIVKSEWQRRLLSEGMTMPADKFGVIFNGVALEHFSGPRQPDGRHRLVYTSQPRRGLDVLLSLFPDIKAQVPAAELHLFSYDTLGDGFSSAVSQPGVFWRGRLPRPVLARELRSAGLMAYPCTFKETFCTAVAEAQAAGLPVVCSTKAALAERVRAGVDGVLVDGDVHTDGFRRSFVDATVDLLHNDSLRTRLGSAARERASRHYDWDWIATQWEAELATAMDRRPPAVPPAPAIDLLAPELLRVFARGRSASVAPELAAQWLRAACDSYGFRVDEVAALRSVARVTA